MRYKSTRGDIKGISFIEAVMMGLAEDGGLLIPDSIPKFFERDLKHFSELNYQYLAFEIMRRFIDDIPNADLMYIINKSYSSNFRSKDIIPIVKAGGVRIAELFHGPTFAFKDIALQFLGNLFEYILKKSGKSLNIIGATSGDTGSAAIYGVRGKENINIFIVYPNGRISSVQELQMTSVSDKNVFVIPMGGNFDNCQGVIKELFNDLEFRKNYKLGAINSINWARILAQIIYYFYIYFRSVERIGNEVNFVVPTGNFGNVFAGYIAKRMGLPIDKLILATNRNNILNRAIKFGDYTVERMVSTHSPSMDIQIASNFERYLYYLYNESSEKVVELMDGLATNKEIEIKGTYLSQIQRDFVVGDAEDSEIEDIIKKVYNMSNYVIDPHTACGVHVAYELELNNYSTICLATAHPAKFSDVLYNDIVSSLEVPEEILALKSSHERPSLLYPDVNELKSFIISKLEN